VFVKQWLVRHGSMRFGRLCNNPINESDGKGQGTGRKKFDCTKLVSRGNFYLSSMRGVEAGSRDE
jgi:hypothetical protein